MQWSSPSDAVRHRNSFRSPRRRVVHQMLVAVAPRRIHESLRNGEPSHV